MSDVVDINDLRESYNTKMKKEELQDFAKAQHKAIIEAALFAAQELVIPVTGDFLSLQGLSRMMAIIEHIEQAINKSTQHWIVLTRFHSRRRLAQDVKQKISEYFPGQLLTAQVRENSALAESPSFGQSIFEYSKRSYGAQDYSALAKEILKRSDKRG